MNNFILGIIIGVIVGICISNNQQTNTTPQYINNKSDTLVFYHRNIKKVEI